MFTPEAEKARKIKKTFEEDDIQEVDDLYGSLGLTRSSEKHNPSPLGTSHEHRIQNITEPSMPLKSSSSMLRSVAMQDIALNERSEQLGTSQSDATWWGGIAAIGRAAKAVIEMSPPSKGNETFEEVGKQASTGVGLGLAKGGEGVRKVKSNWELDRPHADSPQEQRPPVQRSHSESPVAIGITFNNAEPLPSFASIMAPPPLAIEEDAFGYCPLPEDYEAQCDEDEVLYAGGFEDDSVITAPISDDFSEAQKVEEALSLAFGSGSTIASVKEIGQRVMEDAIEYDDYESPPNLVMPLPDVNFDDNGVLTRPAARRASTSPSPEPEVEAVQEQPKPVLKYGDRALRLARSTPAFTQTATESSWLGSIRHALLGKDEYQPVPTSARPRSGPLRVTPAVPAAPALVTTSAVICDSISTEAEDLPPIQSASGNSSGPLSSMALRLRPSLARLRQVVGFSEPPPLPTDDGTTPTLSPRLDWDIQGAQYAGWNKTPKRGGLPWASVAPVHDGKKGSIDYTKSFFYKPATPPQPDVPVDRASSATAVGARKQRSIKSLRAALLLPVAPPPVPAIPPHLVRNNSSSASQPSPLRTPPMNATMVVDPPVLAILSPGAYEAGLPPRQLVLEGEEWDARDGGSVGDWGKRLKPKVKGKGKLKKKGSKKRVGEDVVHETF